MRRRASRLCRPQIRSSLRSSLRFKSGFRAIHSVAFSLEKMIEAMASIGLSSVELWDGHLNPMKATEADFKATRKKFDDAGIRVSAYCVNFPLNATDEHLDRGYNGALLLGTNVMTASVKKAIVPRLDEWGRKYKVKMGLHNHWFGDPWFKGDRTLEFETPEDFKNALKASSEYISVNLDIGHYSAAGFDSVCFHPRASLSHSQPARQGPATATKRTLTAASARARRP